MRWPRTPSIWRHLCYSPLFRLLSSRPLGAASQSGRRVALFACSAPLVGYAYQNPPLVLPVIAAVIVTVLLAALLGGRDGAKRAALVALSGGILLVICSAYWIVPAFLQAHVAPVNTLASLSSWTWTEQRATTANAFWLNTDWGWIYNYYYPFAPSYSAFPLVLLRFLPPIAAFAALLLPSSHGGDRIANKRLLLVALIACCSLLLIALSTGTNPPGSVLFDRLYSLPFGWLLREPGRFLLVVALCYAALIAIGVDALARGVRAAAFVDFLTNSRLRKATAGAAFAALIVAPGYPLLTGQIVPSFARRFSLGPCGATEVLDANGFGCQSLEAGGSGARAAHGRLLPNALQMGVLRQRRLHCGPHSPLCPRSSGTGLHAGGERALLRCPTSFELTPLSTVARS